MTFTYGPFKYLATFLGAVVLVGPLAAPTTAQNRSATPYCFAMKDTLSVFARPANNAATGDRFNRGDIAYATTNPPTVVVQGGRSFIEVAIYGGNKAWVPQRSTVDGAPILVDFRPTSAPTPRPMRRGGGDRPGGQCPPSVEQFPAITSTGEAWETVYFNNIFKNL